MPGDAPSVNAKPRYRQGNTTELNIASVDDLRIVVNTPLEAATWARLPMTRRSEAQRAGVA